MPIRWDIAVRRDPICRGCGQPKEDPQNGGLVCWGCFKFRDNCLKYFASNKPQQWAKTALENFNDWLRSIGRGEHVVVPEEDAIIF